MNLNLVSGINYFCDLVSANSSAPSLSSEIRRVSAKYIGMHTLQCDFMPLKAQLEQFVERHPIQVQFLNLTVQIRAETTRLAAAAVSTIIASTTLYAFNCSHFSECSQCLHPHLAGSCMWCASHSRCVFVRQNILTRQSIVTKQNNEVADVAECPGEIEFYQRRDVCTSMKVALQSSLPLGPVEVAYMADSRVGELLNLAIKNRHLTYQTRFKCVFTPNKTAHGDQLLPPSSSAVKWGSAQTMSPRNDVLLNVNSFDCVFAPYAAKWLDSNVALQRVYFSVWWSNSKNEWSQVKNDQGDEENSLHQDRNYSNENNFIELKVINCEVIQFVCFGKGESS